MPNDPPSTTGPAHRSLWDRLGHMLAGEPRNPEELLEELREAQSNGLLTGETYAMIEGAIRVTEMVVGDVMVPRAQMVTLDIDDDLQTILDTVVESGHSRFPVHGEDKDEVLGILLAKDLLRRNQNGSPNPGSRPGQALRALLRHAVMIPESMRLNVLLAEFRRSRNHMAVVVDEYGGVAGLVTIEDVLEEIVGEIDDEHDDAVPPRMIVAQADGSWLVDALTPIEDFNEKFHTVFSDEEYDTVGGLVTAEFGHLPDPGETASLGEYSFDVTRADDRRVLQFRVRRVASA
ncbi:MAG: CBS domain-containing protein [Xanthomonadales bacterium]|nr:CBS domain-containing protein [Xanthomonadales bacterium]ODU93347.1 MAG: magnesium/cobalt efflux protein [Rhodanobacter sp. SCN 66-43]OJY83103.1 MAG: magnesium/cobalt efflux protein [Xanthomonadales bacterium 66-474]